MDDLQPMAAFLLGMVVVSGTIVTGWLFWAWWNARLRRKTQAEALARVSELCLELRDIVYRIEEAGEEEAKGDDHA